MKLTQSFFSQDPTIVAEKLLGNILVHEINNQRIAGIITETESYGDDTDLASHARFGVTERNKIMFGKAGLLYVYHIYGIFYLTNIICDQKGKAGAVLIRSAQITEGENLAKENLAKSKFVKINQKLATGPGKLSLAFGIDKNNNFEEITTQNSNIYIERNIFKFDTIKTARIGVDYAKHCKDNPWRFYIKDNETISKK